ncbi:hypothetical protein C1T31_12915 [Hanstruepera neustonica]|uniref:Competence protein n=1 Tax=Hanstruepera neustonica TaxID=1445657 RepID=A0A2K1DW05_9FLAO|nr:hypothetical protein [Hanstruepera neustonica]PNQ72221.1 hypothetical protein C1T31_12915 [Hanstruepera neustonica]
MFESINESSAKMADAGETYIKKSQEYYKLKVFQQISVSVSLVAKVLLIGGLLFVGLFFMALAAAMALGEWLGDLALGYIIVAGVFLLATVIIFFKREVVNKMVIKSLSSKFFDS